ncbi:hypothetical protein [Streptomyces sp. CS081A]|uniref:hypothetical protein n=1 Tax=Streptomyces sp. CS081A TaxID=2162709 RepID=UPI000D5113D1|nr:hypothetical protein [Streptomyces sp. CS081A]PVC77646.1 hypothetical protein DBP18_04625 [Streptomyces sp. CS081A]
MTKLKALPHVTRWAVVAAHAVPSLVLPSGIWRVALTFGAPVARIDDPSTGLAVYQIVLTVVAELPAFLTLGLVREWGEVFPHRLPFLGGRPVGVRGTTSAAPAGAGALFALTGWFTYAAVAGVGRGAPGTHVEGPFQEALFAVCHLPLVAWAPLLLAVTIAYHRRRTAPRVPCASRTAHEGPSVLV